VIGESIRLRALAAVRTALGPAVVSGGPDIPARTPQGSQHVSVSLGATSPLEALNAIVRAHGSMRWRVTYCRPEARLEFAEFGYFTFDGSGFVLGPRFQKDEKGKSYDPCRQKN